ncbi:hypothetical protein, partial [Mesorhizobium sp.]|uniref:hypothetical protein n=1 Tax=Mesorhizobium sp. TaxID=1871066 RepID=UPI0025C31E2F
MPPGSVRKANPLNPLEILHLAFVLLRSLAAVKCPEIAALAGLFVLLARIEPVFSVFDFSDRLSLPEPLLPFEVARGLLDR